MEKIDFVILWVDDSDKEWQKEKEKYEKGLKKDGGNANRRYRDWDMLKYWFRGVEKYAPWVNKIHFVTYGHLPKWLDTTNSKINIVNHSDIIPKEYLPTFNSNVIQFYLNRIKNITEKFVLFDDDFYIVKKVKQTDFFINEKIRASYCETPITYSQPGNVYAHSLLNNMQYINKYYNKKKVYKKNLLKYFNIKYGLKNNLKTLFSFFNDEFKGIENEHICYECTLDNYNKFWDCCKEDIEEASKNKFRKNNDLTTLLVKDIAILDGNFIPRNHNFGKRFTLANLKIVEDIRNVIKKDKYHIICINDNIRDKDFEFAKQELIEIFEKKFPNKSEFEK